MVTSYCLEYLFNFFLFLKYLTPWRIPLFFFLLTLLDVTAGVPCPDFLLYSRGWNTHSSISLFRIRYPCRNRLFLVVWYRNQWYRSHFGASSFPPSCIFSSSSKTSLLSSSRQLQVTTQQSPGHLPPLFDAGCLAVQDQLYLVHLSTPWHSPCPGCLTPTELSGRASHWHCSAMNTEIGVDSAARWADWWGWTTNQLLTDMLHQHSASTDYRRLNLDELILELE